MLRRHGFRIHTRPKSGSTLWEREGKLYTQEEALLFVGLTGRLSGTIK